jgi:hypothetical protein
MNKGNIYKELLNEFPETDIVVLEQVAIHLSQTVPVEMDIKRVIQECGPLVKSFDSLLNDKEPEVDRRNGLEIVTEIMGETKNERHLRTIVNKHKSLAKIAPNSTSYLGNEIFLITQSLFEKTVFGLIDWAENGQPKSEEEVKKLAITYFQSWSKIDDLSKRRAENDLHKFFDRYWLIIELEKLKGQVKDHSSLMNEMRNKKYIDNVGKDVFFNALEKGPLPPNNESKIIWIGKPADAVKFCEHLGMVESGRGKYKTWNDYFVLANGERLYENSKSPESYVKGGITTLLIEEGYHEGFLNKQHIASEL